MTASPPVVRDADVGVPLPVAGVRHVELPLGARPEFRGVIEAVVDERPTVVEVHSTATSAAAGARRSRRLPGCPWRRRRRRPPPGRGGGVVARISSRVRPPAPSGRRPPSPSPGPTLVVAGRTPDRTPRYGGRRCRAGRRQELPPSHAFTSVRAVINYRPPGLPSRPPPRWSARSAHTRSRPFTPAADRLRSRRE